MGSGKRTDGVPRSIARNACAVPDSQQGGVVTQGAGQSQFQSRIAVVDVSPLFRHDDLEGSRAAAKQLSDAFADSGFAVVVGSGVAKERIESLRRAALEFFDQTQAEKSTVNKDSRGGYGHAPYVHMEENGAQLLGDFSRPNDIVESLTYRGMSEAIVDTMPQHPPELKDAIMCFHRDLAEFRSKLVVACELAFDLPPGFLAKMCENATESLRLAHYPDPEREPLPGQMRYGAHVDSYGITILNLDPASPEGLQVQIDGEWVDVPFVEESFVLNVGALLSRWTNGIWKASVHRVVCKPGRRLSIVSGAVRPSDSVVVEVFGPCAADGAKFPPIIASDFYAERVAMHRPSYLNEKGVSSNEVDGLSSDIRAYHR